MPFRFDNQYARLPDAFSKRVEPSPVKQPQWIAFNRSLAEQLGLDAEELDSDTGLEIFSGNQIPDGAEPLAMAYAGHQFGNFVPQLGDGRALLLGEVIDRDGNRRDIQLKGSGPTPFSRRGDGRSALGPVLREYLVSEAMHALGIPTTRALAAVTSGEKVWRETPEPGGVFTRVAASHIRVGTTEFFAARQDFDNLRILVEHTLQRHYPESTEAECPALQLLDAVCQAQAGLIAKWMGVGFIHGVMNTDNMTLSGETIDYGPCAFMDRFDPATKFSYIDRSGRYAYNNQPGIARWNLYRLAEAVLPLIAADCGGDEKRAIAQAEQVLDRFASRFEAAEGEVFAAKLGFEADSSEVRERTGELLQLFQENQVDFTVGFRTLTSSADQESSNNDFLDLFGEDRQPAVDWLQRWQSAVPKDATSRMLNANPAIIPRNHRIEEVIQAAYRNDFTPFDQLHQALQNPYSDNSDFSEYQQPPESGQEVEYTYCGT